MTDAILLLVLCLAGSGVDEHPVDAARERVDAGDRAAAVERLEDALARGQGSFEVRALLGEILFELERIDEAAHYLETALLEAPQPAEAKELRRLLRRADPLFERRESFFDNVTGRLGRVARELAEAGHSERALDLAARLELIAQGPDLRDVQALLSELRSARTAVDLDQAASGARVPGEWPLHTHEGEHYVVQANLEPEVVELVSSTMDDIFSAYVQIYFEGDEGRVQRRKATIRIHPTSALMLANWEGDSTPGGWWSPADWTVVCYDTRTTSQSLDPMLETLFHEASHQFMTMRERGGSSPSWLNEGTATFFEGAQAMADGRVLWPQAARGRLDSLSAMLQSGAGPSLADVVGYSEPASYEPVYYPFGWGLVYFLQQYEDPETLEHGYRAPYQEYMERITTRGGDSRELFDELFLGRASPQGFETLAEFEAAAGPRPRKRPKPADRERIDELLVRALGHVEYLRKELARRPDGEHDGALLEQSIEILERLGRPAATAPAIEALLDLADRSLWQLDEERYGVYAARLDELDSKNAALREARRKSASFAKGALRLLESYASEEPPYLLRAYTFARLAGLALDDETELLPASLELRERARTAGLLLGAISDIQSPAGRWTTIFEDAGHTLAFETGAARTLIEGVRPVARICEAVPIRGEYEIRATLVRHAPLLRATVHGIVVSGTPDGDWIVVGISGRGELSVRRMEFGERGAVLDRPLLAPALAQPVGADEEPLIVVHAYPEGRLEITVGDREAVSMELDAALPPTAFAGLYAKDGKTEVVGLLAELYP